MKKICVLNSLRNKLDIKDQKDFDNSLEKILDFGKEEIISKLNSKFKKSYNKKNISEHIIILNKIIKNSNEEIYFSENNFETTKEQVINIIREVVERD